MRLLLTSLLLFLALGTTYPCGNEYGYSLSGARIYTRYFYLAEGMDKFDIPKINERLEELKTKLSNDPSNYRTLSDIAANLMKIGKADSSVKILEKLIADYPNEYNVIANLGTSYELTGELDSAYKYIARGLELNSSSHRGSEWIHLKILEAKLKDKDSPGWIRRYPIITVEDLIERRDASTSQRSFTYQVNNHFFYQIRTRAPFTPAPNLVIANLLTTLGDFHEAEGTYENALLAYTYALRYLDDDISSRRRVKNKVRKLNQERADQPLIREIPMTFIKMIQKSKVDPELLMLGIDEHANILDSLHHMEMAKKDSIGMLLIQIDSIQTSSSQKIKATEEEVRSAAKMKYYYLAIGLVAGLILSILFMKIKRKS